MTRDVVVGALGSMLVGAAFTALGGGYNWGRNMAIYGGLGALGGGIYGVTQHGKEVDIKDGATIQLKLTQPLKVQQAQ
jgi:outer membrane lipoprotein SlyB